MTGVVQSLVRSGFDIEALLGERYIQMVIGTALDSGVIPSEFTFGSATIELGMIPNEFRLYEPTTTADGGDRPTHAESFTSRILFGHSTGANLSVRVMLGRKNGFQLSATPLDIFAKLTLIKERDQVTSALAKVAIMLQVTDIDSPSLQLILDLAQLTKIDLLGKVQGYIDGPIDLGSASKFKRIENLEIAWHQGNVQHPPCLGVYVNVPMRNGDHDDDFLPARGEVAKARNFLPSGEEMAMASRPGMYADMAKHVYSSTAVEVTPGVYDHAFRKALLNPESERLGDLSAVYVDQIPPLNQLPQNGLRITVSGELNLPTDTDVALTIDLRPKLAADGSLAWNTDFDVDFDDALEFLTIWAATVMGMLFGPAGAFLVLGAVSLIDFGLGIGFALFFQASVREQADATLADVIPDRLTISTRRWDPFYATMHQVVTKPSHAEFNQTGFVMCGRAFVGRQLLPAVDTVIRDEIRSSAGKLTGLRYRIADFATVERDSILLAPGTSRRAFAFPSADEPDLWPLALQQFEDRKNDLEGPLIKTAIPYFPAYVYIRNHQIDQILSLSWTEIGELQQRIRREARAQARARVVALQGGAIRQAVIGDLGPGASSSEIEGEVNIRVERIVTNAMDKYRAPAPLRLVRDGSMEALLRLDLAPQEMVRLQDMGVLTVDDGHLRTIHGHRVEDYVRDVPHHGEEDGDPDDDNLLSRPHYKPTPAGPVFN